MSLKEYIKHSAQSFFIVVTLINAAMMFFGKNFFPDRPLSYVMFGYPILYGLCSMIPVFIMYSAKELTIKQLLVRKFIQMILIIALLILLIFGYSGICIENAAHIAFVSISIIIIYVLEGIISWVINSRNAENLNECLHQYQEKTRVVSRANQEWGEN